MLKKKIKSQKKNNINTIGFLENRILKNPFFIYVNNNKSIENYLKKRNINNWKTDYKYIIEIYNSLDNFIDVNENKDMIDLDHNLFSINFYKDFIASSNKLYEYIEDSELTWVDDFPVVNTYILKQIKSFYSESYQNPNLPIYNTKQDEIVFGIDLLNYVVSNNELLNKEIIGRTPNWEFDRIANLDYILIKMAIVEFLFFMEIPSKVTINEYLEIAKDYSTPKSNIFINGVLDNISKDFESQGKLNKKGRGLL
jgi:N utilization substance protein B